MNSQTIAECMKLSFADTPFPQVVEKLAGAGVRSYTADLVRLNNTYYGDDRDSVDEALPLTAGPGIADTFDAAGVAASVKAIQQGRLGYAAFLRDIMAAGCARYSVFIGGRKAMYFGRNGEFHTEHFPAGR
jgi:uncharacterized protein YbcV (DUF1398 family)